MSQITIGGTTLNFKDSSFTGDQWEQVASWVLNGGAEGIDADAQIATEKAAAASASAAAARNSATSAGESASAAERSAARAESYNSGAKSSAARAATSATNAASSERNAESYAATANGAKYDAESAATEAANSQSAAKQSENHAKTYESDARSSANNAGASERKASTYASSAAESIKHAPRINADGKWELWDATTNAYVATEYTSIGKDGVRGLGWYQHSVKASNPQVFSWTGWPAAPKWGEGDWLYNPDNGNVGLCTSRTNKADGSGSASITYKGTLKGTDGTTPHIGTNGNWYIGDTDTGVSAGGSDLPTVTDEDAGKYLHVNASTNKLEWAEIVSASNYVLTEADKEEIAAMVLSKMSGGAPVPNVNNTVDT